MDEHPLLQANNRAFNYGDGLFESLRVFAGKMPFLERHLERLFGGMATLSLERPEHYNSAFFRSEIEKLGTIEGDFRVRLNVFRAFGGKYLPHNHQPQFLISAEPHPEPIFKLQPNGLQLGFCPTVTLPSYTPTLGAKTMNSLPYILASIYFQNQGWDNCILCNEQGHLAETANANLFFIRQNILHTPAASTGLLPGTMRQLIIELAQAQSIKVKEGTWPLEELAEADGVFLTNAIQGIRWVESLEHWRYQKHPFTPLLLDKLNELLH